MVGRSRFSYLSLLAVLAAIYLVAGKLGLQFAYVNEHVTAVWPPTGIALTALLLWGYRMWPGIALGALLVNVTTADLTVQRTLASMGIAAGNTLEAVLGAYLVNRFAGGRRAFERAQGVFAFAVLAAIASTTVSATLGVVSLSLAGLAKWVDVPGVWFTWWIGDATGDLVFAPPLLLWAADWRWRWGRARALEAGLLGLGLGALSLSVFTDVLPPRPPHLGLAFLCTPPLLWAVFRFGQREVATTMLLLAGIAAWGTLHGLLAGPLPAMKVLVEVQAYLGVTSVTLLAVAAEVSERRQAQQQLRSTLGRISDAFIAVDRNWRITFLNQKAADLVQKSPPELLGKIAGKAFPEASHGKLYSGLQRAMSQQVAVVLEHHYLPSDSWYEVQADPSKDGLSIFVRDISERKRGEVERGGLLAREQAARAEAEALARLTTRILDLLPAGVYVCDAPGGTIRQYNRCAAEIWGRQPKCGDSEERFCGAYKVYIDGKCVPRDQCPTAIAIRERASLHNKELEFERPDGSRVTVMVNVDPLTDERGEVVGAMNVFVDITERKRAEERFRLAVESAPNAMVMVNHEGRIVLANSQTEKLFGYRREELMGEPIEVLVPAHFRACHPEYRKGFFAEPAARPMGHGRDLRARRKDGAEFPVEIGLNPIATEEGMWVLSAIVDITERKRVEEEGAQLLVREREARAEAERVNQLKDEFLATLSHELRTPLTAVLGWARLLRRGGLGEATREQALETIERNGYAQAKMIDELLDVSSIVSGKLRLQVSAVELPAIIDAAIETMRPAAQAKAIRIEKAIEPGVGAVPGDAERLQQVIWNLLSNAVKFTPPGGAVEVRLERLDAHVEIRVSDTGVGIQPEFLPHVFEPFSQADASLSRVHGGLGLGLTIVHRLVELHGGTVQAYSAGAGKGATFSVRLPVAPGRQPPGPLLPAAQDDAPVLRNVRILVVEDEADTRDFLTVLLEGYGAEVRAVGSAQEALEVLDKARTDVLVCDIGLPEEDGYELIRKIRARTPAEGGNIPALALTAYTRPEDRREALAAGYEVYVPKPVDPVPLARAIEDLAQPWRTKRPKTGRLHSRTAPVTTP